MYAPKMTLLRSPALLQVKDFPTEGILAHMYVVYDQNDFQIKVGLTSNMAVTFDYGIGTKIQQYST